MPTTIRVPKLWTLLLRTDTSTLRMTLSLISCDWKERTPDGMLFCPVYERFPEKRQKLYAQCSSLLHSNYADSSEILRLLNKFKTIHSLQNVEGTHGRWALIKAFMCGVIHGQETKPGFLHFLNYDDFFTAKKVMRYSNMSRTDAYRAVAILTQLNIIRKNGAEVWTRYKK